MDVPERRRPRLRRMGYGAAGLVGAYALLAIPEAAPEVPTRPHAQPFAWNRDAMWSALEAEYADRRLEGCSTETSDSIASLKRLAAELESSLPDVDDPRWDAIELAFFEAAARVGGCAEQVPDLLFIRESLRTAAKTASRQWGALPARRNRLYRLLYGTRAAVEEVLLQYPAGEIPTLSISGAVPSSTPGVLVQGVQVHSGDLLVSRGGAPTSAFIARGNDYPGNFSHVALVHVDEATHAVSVIEAHIERGVAIADVDAYLADKKLRIMVLRLRPDHPALAEDPLLPHRAATGALAEARERHIPYDFEMDVGDHSQRFCSEVASAAYGAQGVALWQDLSTFSSPGLAQWMAAFGVRHLETHAPSDLEYDPQLTVVAEWHDPDALWADHLDNAVIDVMLEQAEAGAHLQHDAAMLPVARLLKTWSVALNLIGREGPIPEGMSATVALRARALAERHAALRSKLEEAASTWTSTHGYRPPYWQLLQLARPLATP